MELWHLGMTGGCPGCSRGRNPSHPAPSTKPDTPAQSSWPSQVRSCAGLLPHLGAALIQSPPLSLQGEESWEEKERRDGVPVLGCRWWVKAPTAGQITSRENCGSRLTLQLSAAQLATFHHLNLSLNLSKMHSQWLNTFSGLRTLELAPHHHAPLKYMFSDEISNKTEIQHCPSRQKLEKGKLQSP